MSCFTQGLSLSSSRTARMLTHGAIGGLVRDRVYRRVKSGLNGVIVVDRNEIDILQRTRKLRCIQFNKFQFLRVVRDVGQGGRDVVGIFQLDHAVQGQDHQATGAIRWIVRDGDARGPRADR